MIGLAVVMFFIQLKARPWFILGMFVGMPRQHGCVRDYYPGNQQEIGKFFYSLCLSASPLVQ